MLFVSLQREVSYNDHKWDGNIRREDTMQGLGKL